MVHKQTFNPAQTSPAVGMHAHQKAWQEAEAAKKEGEIKKFIEAIKVHGKRLAGERLSSDLDFIANYLYYLLENTPAKKPDLDTKSIIDVMKVVGALHDLPQATRDAVLISLKKKLLAQSRPGPDLSAWKPAEQYADRKPRPNLGRKETIVEFLQRVWSPVIAAGELPMVKLRQEDPQGYRALFNWKREHGQPSLRLVSTHQIAAARNELEASLPRPYQSMGTVKAQEYKKRKTSIPNI